MIIKISGASFAAQRYFNISQVVARKRKEKMFLSHWICRLTLRRHGPDDKEEIRKNFTSCQLKFLLCDNF